jgi:hypothetical protein
MEPDDPAGHHTHHAGLGHNEWTEEQCVSFAATCPTLVCISVPWTRPAAGPDTRPTAAQTSHLCSLALCRLPVHQSHHAAEHGEGGEDDLVYGHDYSEFELVSYVLTRSASLDGRRLGCDSWRVCSLGTQDTARLSRSLGRVFECPVALRRAVQSAAPICVPCP